jgi:hypothetical protein
VEHLLEQDLHVEVPLDAIDDINLVEVTFLIEPAVGHVALEDHRDGELPDPDVVRDKVQHSREIFLRPEVSKLALDELRVLSSRVLNLGFILRSGGGSWCYPADCHGAGEILSSPTGIRLLFEVLSPKEIGEHLPVLMTTRNND